MFPHRFPLGDVDASAGLATRFHRAVACKPYPLRLSMISRRCVWLRMQLAVRRGGRVGQPLATLGLGTFFLSVTLPVIREESHIFWTGNSVATYLYLIASGICSSFISLFFSTYYRTKSSVGVYTTCRTDQQTITDQTKNDNRRKNGIDSEHQAKVASAPDSHGKVIL